MTTKLTEVQYQAYVANLKRYGLKPADAMRTLVTRDGSTTISNNRDKSDLPAAGWVTVDDLKALKCLIGVPDQQVSMHATGIAVDAHVEYPEPPSEQLRALYMSSKDGCDFEAKLNEDRKLHHILVVATHAYVYGNSERVQQFEPMINRLSFPQPMAIMVTAAEDVTVTAGNPLILESENGQPIVANFGTVTVEPGGEIKVVGGPVQWTSQRFIQATAPMVAAVADSIPTQTLVYTGVDGTPGTDQTQPAGVGSKGTDGDVCGFSSGKGASCTKQPTSGQKGGTGNAGFPGNPGNPGQIYGGGSTDLGTLTGPLTILYGGGNGGKGGKGGQGGNGGPGGDAGPCSSTLCTAATAGPQGDGGVGGIGGSGGDGGSSANLNLSYSGSQGLISVTYSGGNGGGGGDGGAGGSGGNGAASGGGAGTNGTTNNNQGKVNIVRNP